MNKKPKKLKDVAHNQSCVMTEGRCFGCQNEGANDMWDKWEAYYKQHIKENYIRKDSLPSKDEIVKIIIQYNWNNKKEIFYTTSRTTTRYPIQFARHIKPLAKVIIKSIKGE